MKYFLSILLCCIAFTCFAQEPKMMLPIGHTGSINSAEFSPDGKRVVTASGDGTAKIWDANSGLLLADLRGHKKWVRSAQFSPDGKKIATASDDGTAKVWDAASGLLLADLKGHTHSIYSAQFSPDGKKIATASDDSTAKVWDANSGLLIANLKGHTSLVNSAQFSPDGKKIVTASNDGMAKIWNANSGLLLADLKGHMNDVNFAQFSPDGKKIATASDDGMAKVWDANSGLLLANLNEKFFNYYHYVYSAQFSPDGKMIVTASNDNTAKVWDATSGLLLTDLKGHTSNVFFAKFSPDGKRIVTASGDNTAKIWDANSGLLLINLKGHNSTVRAAQFSLDGKRIITASDDGTAKILDTNSGLLLTDLKGHTNNVQIAPFSPDGKKIVIASDDKTVKLWDVETGKIVNYFKGHTGAVWTVSFSADGRKMVTGSSDKTAKIWNIETGALLFDLKGHTSPVQSATFSPDDIKILTRGFFFGDLSLKLWDATKGNLLLNIELNSIIRTSSFAPDSKKIITALEDSTVKIWDANTGNLLNSYKEYNSISSASFSPDGKKIVTTSWDKTAKIWDAISGNLLFNLVGHQDGIFSATFSLDSRKVITTSLDGTAKIWSTNSGLLLADLKGHTDAVWTAKFSTDGNKIITNSVDNTAKIWAVNSGALIADLKSHSEGVIYSQFSPNGKSVITASRDNTCKLWNAETGELLYTFFAVDSTDYLVVDKYNRYDGTERARKLLYFTCGTEVISLDQVKDQLWVPNLAERIMKGETINAPKLSDLNICGTLPLVEAVEGSDSTVYRFAITPQKSGLGETVLYVNDIEAQHYTASQLLRKNNGYELTFPQKGLARFFKQGEANQITVKSFTADNSISSRGVSVISEMPKKATVVPHLYAVMAGVSDYKGTELDLRYAAKDAADLGKAVQAAAARWFGPDHVHLYNLTTDTGRTAFPEKATIRQTLADIGKKATPDDILLLFFAGHGIMGGKDKKQFYFLPADASNATATNAVAQVGISTAELADWMQPSLIKAQKRILILDACNSGQAINDLVKIGTGGQGYLASRSDEQAEQIKAIDKLNERSGLFVLAASASNQSAYEMSRYNQGLLTYALLKAMKQQPDILDDGRYLNVSRWFTAAEKTVTDLAKETGARQQPQIVTAGNFNIGLVDADVMAKITLPGEKPVFTASNFQNEDKSVGGDDLELSTLLNRQLQDISTRGTANDLNFIPNSNMPDAFSLQGSYEVKGAEITVHANIWRNRKKIFAFVVKGSKDKLEELVNVVIAKAKDWGNTIK